MYELGSLAVVNVRDLGAIKHVFKLLAFPDTRVFQCSSNSSKVRFMYVKVYLLVANIESLQKEWLDKFDYAKKARLTQEQQKRHCASESSLQGINCKYIQNCCAATFTCKSTDLTNLSTT